MAFWHRAAKTPRAPDIYELADRFWQALEPLGPFRQQVIACLRGDMVGTGAYRFSVGEGENLFEAFRRFVMEREAIAPPDLDGVHRSILAAGRLLTGDLAGADCIIDLLPETPHVTEHGAGKCKLMPARVLRRVLQIPDDVGDPDRWTAGSQQSTLRVWLARNRAQLVWLEPEGRYHHVGTPASPRGAG